MNPFDTLFGVVMSRLLVEPRADVAVVRRDIAARVHAAAGFDDVGANLFFGAGTQVVRNASLMTSHRRRRDQGYPCTDQPLRTLRL